MQSPFFIARFVSFGLLANLNVLIIAFAAWNASASIQAGISVSATTGLIIFNACALLLGITIGLVEAVFPEANTARVLLECVWTAVLSVFQTGTAISATINGATLCRSIDALELCASSYLVVPVTWASTIILFSHFLTLFIIAVAHARLLPNIWTRSVYSIEWFHHDETGCHTLDPESDTWARYVKDIEANPPSSEDNSLKAPWAKPIRRGVDAPFKSSPPSVNSTPSTAASLPVAPLRIQSRPMAGSRFIERFRESSRLSRPENLSQMQSAHPPQPELFSEVDHDLPIPLPRLSEWIRADDIKRFNVHATP
ncbi:hypothetical protein H0H92_013430 [Tricholoma furcatifolium]|nr:hypothetical protein H0H92_013430 [Tricholoma furcatifolium]